MSRRRAGIGLLACVLLAGACALPVRDGPGPEEGEATKTVFLVAHGWHAGIVIRRADIPPGAWPEHEEFATAEYLEVGWGDRDGYMLPLTSFNALRAILWPTESVLHVAGFSGPVPRFFPRSEILALTVSAAGIERLARHISACYARDAAGAVVRLAGGLYGQGAFYLARDRYHLFNTCNVWTARALRRAGLALTPATALTVDALMEQARPYGTPLLPLPMDGR